MIKHPFETIEDLLLTMQLLGLCGDRYLYKQPMARFWKGRKVAIIGSNPSNESPDDTAFHPDTKSGKIVRSWYDDEDIYVHFENTCNRKGDLKTLKLTTDEVNRFKRSIASYTEHDYRIIACGDFVAKQLDKLKIDYFKMPHPSGLNRFWNDKEAGEAKIKEMLEWVKNDTK